MTTAAGLRRLLLPSYPKYGASPVCQDWWVGRSHIDHRSTESDFHYDRERSVTPVTSEVSARFNGFPLLRTLCQMDSIQMFPSPWSRAWVELTVTSHECVVGLFCFSVTHTHTYARTVGVLESLETGATPHWPTTQKSEGPRDPRDDPKLRRYQKSGQRPHYGMDKGNIFTLCVLIMW